MFLETELARDFRSASCQADLAALRQALVEARLRKPPSLPLGSASRLSYFVECVLASAPSWAHADRPTLCQVSAEASELLSLQSEGLESRRRHRLRAALLYELAGLPAMAAGVTKGGLFTGTFGDFLAHSGAFGGLNPFEEPIHGNGTPLSLVTALVDLDAVALAQYLNGQRSAADSTNADVLHQLAVHLQIGLSSSECAALDEVFRVRRRRSVRDNVAAELFELLQGRTFPSEFFPTQVDALDAGLLDESMTGWGFAAPTGTGKTFVARLLILDALRKQPERGVIYLVPTRALVHEVTSSLQAFFAESEIEVLAVTPQLVSLDDREERRLQEAQVAVLTPEKADLLLRLGSNLLEGLQLVVVDEAHHLEAGTRGALLELYLVRLRQLVRPAPRVVLLSAVTPNIRQLAAWCGGANAGGSTSPTRATRMRPGVFRVKKEGGRRRGWIEYADGTSIRLIDGTLRAGRKLVAQVCEALRVSGPVLAVAKGKRECENLAQALVDIRDGSSEERELHDAQVVLRDRLDSRLRREMYAEVPMRDFIKQGIAYHHAGLPPRVRVAVEDAIRGGLVDVVFATTTLAEGVNFPFSSVLVQSLALREAPERGRPARYHPVTPRSFWNIAGRAGRPGIDHEGQAILFEPSLGLEKVGAVLEPYMDPGLMALDPVDSALKQAMDSIREDVATERLSLDELSRPVLSDSLPRATLGAVNLVRIAIVHGAATGEKLSSEEIVSGTLAYEQSGAAERRFLIDLFSRQEAVLNDFFAAPGAPDPITVSELGLSVDTLTQLRDYVDSLEGWQLASFARVMRGGTVNQDQVKFVLGPVAKRMGELEGRTLGGFYGEIAALWLSGVPLQEVRRRSEGNWGRLEELISVLYSRVQFLLPWGLYAFDKIVEQATLRRGIAYDNEIKSVAYLADAGVPTFDALRLVDLGFERVDSTRLAQAFRRAGGLTTGVDVVAWLKSAPVPALVNAVRGPDQRELDYDFLDALTDLRASASNE